MQTTDLQVELHSFAAGSPAFAFSIAALHQAVSHYAKSLSGKYPDEPHPLMANAPLPLYGLAYSCFIDELRLAFTGEDVQLYSMLKATVHPFGRPRDVIAYYAVILENPLDVHLEYEEPSRTLRWACRTSPRAKVFPAFTPDAETILASLQFEEPLLETYERSVERAIIWNTSNTFVQLVLSALPTIDLGEIAPWMTMISPLRIKVGDRYLCVTANKIRLSLGGCVPNEITSEPDPSFPYTKVLPGKTEASKVLLAVYFPKKRLVDYVAGNFQPAIGFDTGNRGGLLKWRAAGAFGLQSFSIDISGKIEVGNPWSGGNITLQGLLTISTALTISGVARAWVDGPCGTKVGLASADVLGDGKIKADFSVTYHSPLDLSGSQTGAALEAEFAITQADVDPNIDINLVGWPIDDIAGEIGDYIIGKEIRKLAGKIRQQRRWDVMSVPEWLADLFDGKSKLAPLIEASEDLSVIFGISDMTG